MMRRLAGVCCGGGDGACAARQRENEGVKDVLPEVIKPTLAVGVEEHSAGIQSLEDLAEVADFVLAPPGAVEPVAVVSPDFPRNCSKVLVLIPSRGAPPGCWDAAAEGGRGDPLPIFRWADANGYASCLFSAAHIWDSPAATLDRVLRGSPAGSVFVLAAGGDGDGLPMLAEALAPLHQLLRARFRFAMAPFSAPGAWPPAWPADMSPDLAEHLAAAVVRAPVAWGREQQPSAVMQQLFQVLAARETRFHNHQARKFAGFQNLKENDMPGLRRLGVEERVKRLDRDRGNDELAQLLQKNDRDPFTHAHDPDEPDVD